MIRNLIRPGIEAVKEFWKPMLLIELCGLVVVVAYFKSAHVKAGADVLGQWSTKGGVLFAMAACAIASAVVPELAKMIALGDTHWDRRRWNNLVFNLVLFSIMGGIAIYFYELQQWLFGDDGRIVTSLKKTAVDQFLYTPIITLPAVSIAFTWREVDWSVPRLLRAMTPSWYARRIGRLIIPCWCFWIPMTTLMYSLPPGLVFPFSMCAQAAWVLVMLFVAERSGQAQPSDHVHAPAAVQDPGVALSGRR
ncbi:MAG: hypothetical protein H7144_10370 [Burkholderiales bacterium]|nr:hypothetical protein [Phycisphaerae bacterium]